MLALSLSAQKTQIPIEKDITIIGAGPSGLSLAIALAKSGLAIAVIDKQEHQLISDPACDGRDIAMTHLSKSILQAMNVWQRFHTNTIYPLKDAKVSDGNTPYMLHFERNDKSDNPLGFLVPNHAIRKALYDEATTHQNIEILYEREVSAINEQGDCTQLTLSTDEVIQSQLVVAADSRFSISRRIVGIGAKMKDYGRVMIVCNMKHELSHEHTAQECFNYGHTCAILPLGEKFSSIVITVAASKSHSLLSLDEEAFNKKVQELLSNRLGVMTLISERNSYPLVGVYSDKFIAKRFALVGDAAVGMHPVTAHGYNLALRSIDTLAKQIIEAKKEGKDIGNDNVLTAYQFRHRLLAKPIYEATNMIVSLYTNDNPVVKKVRQAAIRVSDKILPFKQLIAYRLTNT